MNKKNLLVVLGIVLIIAGGYFVFRQKTEVLPQQGLNNPPAQSSPLQPPKVTAYQGGFVKIEIPLSKKVSYKDRNIIIKSAFAAEPGQIYEVYRSVGSSNNFAKIAMAISSEGTSYLAVFDKDYPRDSKTLSYRYARLDNNEPIFSGVSTADLQQAVDEGHQPWRFDPLWVAEADNVLVLGDNKFRTPCGGFGSDNSGKDFSNGTGKLIGESGSVTYCDVFTLISVAASAGVAEAEVVHDGKIYIIDLIKPVPGDGKIWIIKEIREKA